MAAAWVTTTSGVVIDQQSGDVDGGDADGTETRYVTETFRNLPLVCQYKLGAPRWRVDAPKARASARHEHSFRRRHEARASAHAQ